MLPLWEGWDEYAHFAWLEHWNDRGTLPVASDHVSAEIDMSMQLAPLARELRWIGPPYLTHSDWWALPAGEREKRERALRDIKPAGEHPFALYEAQQPPLYYWLSAPGLKLVAGRPLRDRVFAMRLLAVLFTSLAIPFTSLAAGPALACFCAALLAVAPGMVIDGSHVANDSLAIGVTAIFLWLMTREKTGWAAAGLVLGAAILTKASLLVLIPVLAVLWFRKPKKMGLAIGTGLAIGGWWYVRNLVIGAPLTGWQESVPLSRVVSSAVALFHNGGWLNEFHTISKSFTWFGAWSFMTLRTWMYLVVEGFAFAGMLAALARERVSVRVPLTFVALFALAITGGAAAYFAVHNVAGIPGWYLWPAGGAMAILIVAGVGRLSVLFAALLALTDLYGMTARMLPYYSGLAPWNHGSITQSPEALARLHVSVWLAVAWAASTVAIPILMYQGRAKTRT